MPPAVLCSRPGSGTGSELVFPDQVGSGEALDLSLWHVEELHGRNADSWVGDSWI